MATGFLGSWRITWTEAWESDALDLVGPAFIQFEDDGLGELGLMAISASLDCRYGQRDGRPAVEFSWEGDDEDDIASGRGWAVLESDGSLRGWFFVHRGDDSEFRAAPLATVTSLKRARPRRGPPAR